MDELLDFKKEVYVEGEDCFLHYYPNFLAPSVAWDLFAAFCSHPKLDIAVPERNPTLFDRHLNYVDMKCDAKVLSKLTYHRESIKIFGKEYKQPRLTTWLGYFATAESKYRHIEKTVDFSPFLSRLVLVFKKEFARDFNSALVNVYRSGQDGMGMHADDEPILGEKPLILGLSLGGIRKLKFRLVENQRRKSSLADSLDIECAHGSLVAMGGKLQSFYKHGVPKTKKDVPARINLTFRNLKV